MKTGLRETVDAAILKAAGRARTLQFEVSVPSLDFAYAYSSLAPRQAFHSASVGKLMTATLVFMAVERGLASLDTPVASLLPGGLLEGLFLPDPTGAGPTIGQLAGHTSGVNDYFEGVTRNRRSFVDEVLSTPDRLFTPAELVGFTREHQRPAGMPGERFLYSDTGYVLLGLVVEHLFDMPFHRALREFLFDPLEMKDTGLCFHDERFDPARLAPAVIRRKDIHLYRSLSCDFSGGGLVTTTRDLTLFLKALKEGRILSERSMRAMTRFEHSFRPGMLYGLGMMELRFEQFFFLLKGMPRLRGHLGVLGVHAWYHPADGDTYVLNVGSADDMVASFRLLIRIVQLIEREKRRR